MERIVDVGMLMVNEFLIRKVQGVDGYVHSSAKAKMEWHDFFNVRPVKSCDAAKLGRRSKPAAVPTLATRKLIRVASVTRNLKCVVSCPRAYIQRLRTIFTAITRRKRRSVYAFNPLGQIVGCRRNEIATPLP